MHNSRQANLSTVIVRKGEEPSARQRFLSEIKKLLVFKA